MDAGRSPDVTCDEILAAYSDYLDGLLVPHEAAKVQWHLASCPSCGRYDRVVRRGAELARELPAIEPSDDFAERLQHRLFHVQDGPAIAEARSAGAAATLTMAGVIALLAWSPLFLDRGSDPGAELAGFEGTAPAHAVQLTDAAEPDLWTSAAGLMPLAAPAMLTLRGGDAVQVLSTSVPGPYSPLVVEPPVYRPVRTISIE